MNEVIKTNPGLCRDCYRCVRTCPVKAVRVREGQARIVHDLCITCASCVSACPQGAKVIRDDLSVVQKALAEGRRAIASVAPSAPAYFDILDFAPMAQALRELGFYAVGETAFGAEMVGLAHGELLERVPTHLPLIASACPVVVNLVEQYYPDLIPHLAPIVSPMIAHGRYLRQQYGDNAFIVFIGPCIAKKGEINADAVTGVIDAALTFAELEGWMRANSVEIAPPMEHNEPAPRVNARLFPIEGGLVGTAKLDTDILSGHIVTATGIEACKNALKGIRGGKMEARLVEIMACEGGCINGPVLTNYKNVFLSRQRVIAYGSRRQPQPLPKRAEWPSLERTYRDRRIPIPWFSEEQIKEVLHRTDKFAPEDELNCGACGYESCRDKAVAVLRGMAEATMCIPYMRARAESLTNVVMDSTPNAIIIVDKKLNLQDMSPSAETMFGLHRGECHGMPLREITHVVGDFLEVLEYERPVMNKIVRLRDDLIVEQNIVPVSGRNLIIATMRDVTERERQREEMEKIRSETLHRTQEVINKQMRVAHEIAGLLGETTAETKVLLTQLARLIEGSQDGANG